MATTIDNQVDSDTYNPVRLPRAQTYVEGIKNGIVDGLSTGGGGVWIYGKISPEWCKPHDVSTKGACFEDVVPAGNEVKVQFPI